jgi:hypothetical protein
MTRSTEEIVAMKRRDLAAIHAAELNAALYPSQRQDDDLTMGEKTAIQEAVAALVAIQRQELAAWSSANS